MTGRQRCKRENRTTPQSLAATHHVQHDLSQCRPRVGCRPSTAHHRRRHVQYTATPTVTQQAAGLLTQPTYTVYKKKIRPPARISSKISDDKQLIFFYSA